MGNPIVYNLLSKLNLLIRVTKKVNQVICDKGVNDESKVLSIHLLFMDLHSDLERVEQDFISKVIMKRDIKSAESICAFGNQFTMFLN